MPAANSRLSKTRATQEELDLASSIAGEKVTSLPWWIPPKNFDPIDIQMDLPDLDLHPNGHTQLMCSGRLHISVYNGYMYVQERVPESSGQEDEDEL